MTSPSQIRVSRSPFALGERSAPRLHRRTSVQTADGEPRRPAGMAERQSGSKGDWLGRRDQDARHMRPGQNGKRSRRGRNNNKPHNVLNRTFESNGPDVKVRGNAAHVYEKYLTLARDAASSGDRVMAENYLQHAEHYYRLMAAAQAAMAQQNAQHGQGGHHPHGNGQNGQHGGPRPHGSGEGPQPALAGGLEDDEGDDDYGPETEDADPVRA